MDREVNHGVEKLHHVETLLLEEIRTKQEWLAALKLAIDLETETEGDGASALRDQFEELNRAAAECELKLEGVRYSLAQFEAGGAPVPMNRAEELHQATFEGSVLLGGVRKSLAQIQKIPLFPSELFVPIRAAGPSASSGVPAAERHLSNTPLTAIEFLQARLPPVVERFLNLPTRECVDIQKRVASRIDPLMNVVRDIFVQVLSLMNKACVEREADGEYTCETTDGLVSCTDASRMQCTARTAVMYFQMISNDPAISIYDFVHLLPIE